MKRFDIVNWFIKEREYKTYLEIGIDNPANCFNKIIAITKYSVDPQKGKPDNNHAVMTSDVFFGRNTKMFDIIFIDGLHEGAQVIRDVENGLECLKNNGTIIVHDCNPQSAIAAEYPRHGQAVWNGSVYKGFAWLRANRTDLTMCCVDTDHGCGIIRKGAQYPLKIVPQNYEEFAENRELILNLITVDMMYEFYRH